MAAVLHADWASCPRSQNGLCRAADALDAMEICASGYWQRVASGTYTCENGQLAPQVQSSCTESTVAVAASSSYATSFLPLVTTDASYPWSLSSQLQTGSTPSHEHPYQMSPSTLVDKQIAPKHDVAGQRMTGYASCCHEPVPFKDDAYGIASYRFDGKMASMYNISDGALRCNLPRPADGFFVAVWTRYNGSPVGSQPMPANCGIMLSLKNPKSGKKALAPVLDRCASCVGVGRQTSDPTTPDIYVNGATVDLSLDLFEYLYNGATTGVYDIEYDGALYGGERDDGVPDLLTAPDCTVAC